MTHRARLLATSLLLTLGFLVTACGPSTSIQGPRGIISLIILVLDIIAIVQIVQSSASLGTKVLWILVILLLPLVGLILWWIFGRK